MYQEKDKTYVSVMTDRGRIVGSVYKFGGSTGVMWVEHISSGSIVMCPIASSRPATDDEIRDMWKHVELAERLHESERNFADSLASTSNDKRVQVFIDFAKKNGLTVSEAGGFIKFTGKGERGIYLSKNCRRIDLTGFSIEHPLMKQVSEVEAKFRRLGRVRAQATGIADEDLDELLNECLTAIIAM